MKKKKKKSKYSPLRRLLTKTLTLPPNYSTLTMNFTATEQQIKEIALKAILASKVIGMGVIQFKNAPLTLEDIELDDEGLYIDYFRGRIVKLGINKEGDNIWEIKDSVDVEYQSWGETYPTVQDLVSSVIKKEEYNKVEESD